MFNSKKKLEKLKELQNMKNMKEFKNMKIVKVPIFAIVIVVLFLLRFFNNIISPEKEKEDIEQLTAISETELTLNEFLVHYDNKEFERVELHNQVLLKGYVPTTGAIDNPYANLLKRDKDEVMYEMYTAYKPVQSSIADIGITPLGDVPFVTTYSKQNTLVSFFVNHILPLLFFMLILLLLFRFMGPKG